MGRRIRLAKLSSNSLDGASATSGCDYYRRDLGHLALSHQSAGIQLSSVSRELDNKLAPAIRIPAHRAVDLYELLRMVAHGGNSADTLKILLEVLIDQF